MTQVTAVIREVSSKSASDVPVTASLVLKEGDFFDVGVLLGGQLVESQLNIRARHGDGSIRHCLVTFKTDVAAGAEQTVVFDSDQSKSAKRFPVPDMDWDLLACRVTLTDSSDQVWIRDIPPELGWPIVRAGALPNWSHYRTGLEGPIGAEVEFQTDLDGAISGKHPNITVMLRWKLYDRAKGARIEAVVENSSYPQMDDVSFKELKIEMGGQEVLLLKNGIMYAGQRLRRTEWVGEVPPELIVRQDPTYLREIAVWPLYDTSSPFSDASAEKELQSDFDKGKVDPENHPDGIPLTSGPIFNYMPGTGGRRDIGPLPGWAVVAINSRALKAEQVLRAADGNAAGAFSVHMRGPGGYMGLTYEHHVTKAKGDGRNPNVVDRAHQPNIGYPSYVLTGERYYEEEIMAYASYCTREWPWKKDLKSPGSRDSAWSLRAVSQAAYILPDTNPLKGYFLDIFDHNMDIWVRDFMDPTTFPLHTWSLGGWKSSGRKNWPCGGRFSPWQFAWHVWSLYRGYQLLGDERAEELYKFSCHYFQECYARQLGSSFTSKDGQKITWDPLYADQYSFCVSKHEPFIDDDGDWDVVPGSQVALTNLAECLWYLHVNSTNEWSGGDYPDMPKEGPAPENWTPTPPEARKDHSTFEEYAMADLAPLMAFTGIEHGDEVWKFIEPYVDAKGYHPGYKQVP